MEKVLNQLDERLQGIFVMQIEPDNESERMSSTFLTDRANVLTCLEGFIVG